MLEKFTFNVEDTNYVSSFSPVPDWMSEEAIKTLNQGYLLPGECPRDLYYRVACQSARILNRPDIMRDLFDILYQGFLGLSTPVASNFGANRGLPISCFGANLSDNIPSIYSHLKEGAMMSKNGGGVAFSYSNIRGAGAPISAGGISTGIVPIVQQYDKCANYVSQSNIRRGSFAHYLSIEHPDAYELLLAKDHLNGDPRKMIDGNIAFTITDSFMEKVLKGDKEASRIFGKALETNLKTGSPYFFFIDNVNKANPQAYINHNLKVESSNLCLAGDTLIATDKGFYSIKKLVGKTVNIFDGEQWVSNSHFSRQGQSKLIEVELHNGQTIKMTPEHRCYVNVAKTNTFSTKKQIVLAKDLTRNMRFVSASNISTEGFVEEKGAYLKGFLLGDGSSIKDRPILHLYDTKFVCEDALIKSGEELQIENINTSCKTSLQFTEAKEYTNPEYYGRSTRKSMQGLSCRKKELYPWVSSYREGIAVNVSEWVITSRLQFISGYFDADGSGIRYLQASSKNEQQTKDIATILFSLGYSPNLDTVKHSNGRISYRVSLSSWDSYHLFKEGFFQRLSWQGQKPNRDCTNTGRRIKHITYTTQKEDVYCTKVLSTSLFALGNNTLTGNCSEITLFTDEGHSFVCCLSSLNLARWNEWKTWKGTNTNKSVVELSVYLLDSVIEEFIRRAKNMVGMGRSVRSAEKGRALGLGSMGIAYLYQLNNLPFKSLEARALNIEIHKQIQQEAIKASKDLAVEYGEPEWCKGTGMRNTHLIACAPTRTNSVISGAFSAGIEPIDSNAYTAKQAKGSFTRKNPLLQKLLQEKGIDSSETWEHILNNNGSVLYLDSLSINEKLIFLTAREIDQEELIRQASDRTPYICQAQSLNRFVHPNIPLKQLSELVFKAWKGGVKSTYYTKSSSEQVLSKVKNKATIISKDNCPYCDKAKQLFKELNIDYTEYSRKDVVYFPWKTVPQIWYEGHFIGGYSELLEYTATLKKDVNLLSNNKTQYNITNKVVIENTLNVDYDNECESCSG